MSFWHAHPRSRWHSSFWRFYLSTSAFQFFLEHNVRFLCPLSQQSLLYKILHYCKTITLFVVIMPWRIFHNNYIHKKPWFEHCASLFQCTKSFLTRTVIDVCMYVKWFTDYSFCGGWLPWYPFHCVKTALVYANLYSTFYRLSDTIIRLLMLWVTLLGTFYVLFSEHYVHV
jgi:hypothetical protein